MASLWDAFSAVLTLASFAVSHWLLLAVGAFAYVYVAPYFLDRAPPVKKSKRPASKPVVGKGRDIPCTSPSTGESLGTQQAYTAEQVAECMTRARKAQAEWAQTSFAERRAVMRDLLDYVVTHQEEICTLSMTESGKTLLEAEYGEILTTCEKIRWTCQEGENILKPSKRGVPLLMFLKKAAVEYVPLGVIGIIIPWNYPFHNIISHVVSSLFAGNAAVVKVSEWASYSRGPFEAIFRKVLAKRGHNPDLVQIITGYGDTGAALIQGGVDKVLFIGSPATGRKVMQSATVHLTPVILELGGKDPFIVFDDAEFEQAVATAVRGVFINNGCNCIAAERLYVHERVYDRFEREVIKRVKALRQGASVAGEEADVGAISMEAQIDIVDKLVADSVRAGAKLATGGKRTKGMKGWFYEPTVLTNVREGMPCVENEMFGPVMTIMRFKTEEELIRRVNKSEFGLGCSIFSTDYAKAHRVARAIQSGMVTINDFGVSYLIQSLPFGGCKLSGFGVFNGPEGLRAYTTPRSFVTDRFPVRTHVPPVLEYPNGAAGPKVVEHACKLIYCSDWATKGASLVSLLKLFTLGRE